MELPVDLYAVPSVWKETKVTSPQGVTYRFYEDPTRQFVSLTPVAESATLQSWWLSHAFIPPSATFEVGLRMQQMMVSSSVQASELWCLYAVEEWWAI